MPIAPQLRKYYGYRWKRYDRPAAMRRAGGKCVRCGLPEYPQEHYCPACALIPRGKRKSRLEGAHLDGDPRNRADDNVVMLCRICHRAHDYAPWAAKLRAYLARKREQRIDAHDRERAILVYLADLDKEQTLEAVCT